MHPPPLSHVEHMLEEGRLAVDGRRRNFPDTVLLIILHPNKGEAPSAAGGLSCRSQEVSMAPFFTVWPWQIPAPANKYKMKSPQRRENFRLTKEQVRDGEMG